MEKYDKNFYKLVNATSSESAKEIVPVVMNLLSPKSVVDVGCGLGNFLSEFSKQGVKKVLGIDGDWVNLKDLLISEKDFIKYDLTKPLNMDKKFDLVVSLEVAEHLPKESAEEFVDTLTKLGNVILFSAAIPNQGGVNHLNEQWHIYWEDLFLKKGYIGIDFLRKTIWNNKKISWWYRQNIVLFVKKESLKKNKSFEKKLKSFIRKVDYQILPLIHPENYLYVHSQNDNLKKEHEIINNLKKTPVFSKFIEFILITFSKLRK